MKNYGFLYGPRKGLKVTALDIFTGLVVTFIAGWIFSDRKKKSNHPPY